MISLGEGWSSLYYPSREAKVEEKGKGHQQLRRCPQNVNGLACSLTVLADDIQNDISGFCKSEGGCFFFFC